MSYLLHTCYDPTSYFIHSIFTLAFAQGGLLLGSICMAFVSLQSHITGTYTLEACARAEALKVSSDHRCSGSSRAVTAGDSDGVLIERQDPEEHLRPTISSAPKRYLPNHHSYRVHDRTYELSELCRIFLGRWPRNFFTCTTVGDLYGITWTFAAVFGSSLSEHLPIGTDSDYRLYIFIFMAVAIPVSCMRIVVQMPLQMAFLIARTIMLFLMLGTLLAAYITNASHFGMQETPTPETPFFAFTSIITVMQLCIFSTAFQFSVPGLASETRNKQSMFNVLTGAVTYIYLTNLVLSLVVAFYFGKSTEASSNLNWLYYHGGTWDGTGAFTRSWWAEAISSYIVLFAALDGLAVYPLIATSLGDILMGAIYEDSVHQVQKDWKTRIVFRLVASVPQAIGSLFLKDLGAM